MTSKGEVRPCRIGAQLSHVICWTRMQAEAGQGLDAIVLRKELERRAGDGLFCWGIGNAPPRSLHELVRHGAKIDVVFSTMKSRPKPSDVAPDRIIVWRSYFDGDGVERLLPPNVLITSGLKSPNRAHYALMCFSEHALELRDMGGFDPKAYLNVSEAGRPVGASQVTALLRRVCDEGMDAAYRINLRASLVKSFWVKLGSPIELTTRKRVRLADMLALVRDFTTSDWVRLVLGTRSESRERSQNIGEQLALFGA